MIFLRWLLNALILLLVSQLLPGFVLASFWTALWAAVALGLVNALVRPILLLLTLPINLLTLGLFTFVINALMLVLVAKLVPGFSVADFGTAVVAAIILWLVSLATNHLLA